MNKEFVPKRYDIFKMIFCFGVCAPIFYLILNNVSRLGIPLSIMGNYPMFVLMITGFLSGIFIKRFFSKKPATLVTIVLCLVWMAGGFLMSFLLVAIGLFEYIIDVPKPTDKLQCFVIINVIPALFCALGMNAKNIFEGR